MTRINKFNSPISGFVLILVLCVFGYPVATTAHVNLHKSEVSCDLSGKVINIMDADTLRILDKDNQQHKIRLAGIDAPEKRQAFGSVARTYLSQSVKHKTVCVNWDKRGRYGRIIGIVYIGDTDVNLDLIRNGLAWHYKKYQKDQTPQDQQNYAQAEKQARENAHGLWQDDKAIAPWIWRKQEKEMRKQKKQLQNQNKRAAQDKKQVKKEANLTP